MDSGFHPKGATHNSNPNPKGMAKQTKMKGEMDFKLKNRGLLDVGLPAKVEVKLNFIFGYITNDFFSISRPYAIFGTY